MRIVRVARSLSNNTRQMPTRSRYPERWPRKGPDIADASLRVVPNRPQDALNRGSLKPAQVSFRLTRINGRAGHTPNSFSRSS